MTLNHVRVTAPGWVSLMEPRCYASTDSVIKMKTNDSGNGSLENNYPQFPSDLGSLTTTLVIFGEVILVGFLCGPEVDINLAGFLCGPEVEVNLAGFVCDRKLK